MFRVSCIVVVLAGCTQGIEGGVQGDASADGTTHRDSQVANDAAVDGPPAGSSGLKVTFTTSVSPAPVFNPKNIVAVWIQNAAGNHVKTIGRWAATRKQYLLAWNAKAGTNDVDAVSGATRANHTPPLTVTWNLKDKAGAVVPDGTYTIRMEEADRNATAQTQNNEGTFTFVKGAAPQTQNNLTNGGFSAVKIEFTP